MSPTVLYRWQKEFFENGAAAFERGSNRRERKLEERVDALTTRLAHKDEVIAEMVEAHIALKNAWGGLKASWVEPDVRDEVVDFVRSWSEKTELPTGRLVGWLGISRSKYHDWRRRWRYGRVNEHHAGVPRDFWLQAWEKEAIIGYYLGHRADGYRRLTYMVMDEDIVAVSPSSVYRVLRGAGLLGRWNGSPSKQGTGFQQPAQAHAHWHTDISHINICGTFYYLCSVLDGFSRYIVHWEIRETMTEADVEIILQRAREAFPEAHPRTISDNGPQFIARDFREFIRLSGMTHVRTSPFYPQSNGKQERWYATLKRECIRPGTPLSLEDARRIVADFVAYYNEQRLHSAIGYLAPKDKLAGRADAIWAERAVKLAAARQARKNRRQRDITTGRKEVTILHLAGETDASSAGGQLPRDSRLGGDEYRSGGASRSAVRLVSVG